MQNFFSRSGTKEHLLMRHLRVPISFPTFYFPRAAEAL